MLQSCTWRPQIDALLCRAGSSWTILVALQHSLQPPVLTPEHLLSTLQQQQVPVALGEASSSGAQPDASAAAGWTPQQLLAAAERQQASHWGLYERQRRALQVAQPPLVCIGGPSRFPCSTALTDCTGGCMSALQVGLW